MFYVTESWRNPLTIGLYGLLRGYEIKLACSDSQFHSLMILSNDNGRRSDPSNNLLYSQTAEPTSGFNKEGGAVQDILGKDL